MTVRVKATLQLTSTSPDLDRETAVKDMERIVADVSAGRTSARAILEETADVLEDLARQVHAVIHLEVTGDGPLVTRSIPLR